MTLLTIPTILILSLLFTRLNRPLSLGLTLLTQTIMISMTTGISTYSYWFSYILFMIFLGGMLVLFIYVASLASNEPFSFSLATFTFYFLLFSVTTLLCLLLDPISTPHLSSLPTSSAANVQLSTPILVSWVYNNTSMIFTLFIILYLLLTLIVVVKITNLYKGPLRLSD